MLDRCPMLRSAPTPARAASRRAPHLHSQLGDGQTAAVAHTQHLRVVHSLLQDRLLGGQVLAVVAEQLTAAQLGARRTQSSRNS